MIDGHLHDETYLSSSLREGKGNENVWRDLFNPKKTQSNLLKKSTSWICQLTRIRYSYRDTHSQDSLMYWTFRAYVVIG